MSDETLKPCPNPWCLETNAEVVVTDYEDKLIFQIYCPDCDTASFDYGTEAECLAAWNTRPIEDALRARVKQLDSLNHTMINGQHRLEQVVLKYQDRIKELDSRLDHYASVNDNLMKEKLKDAETIKGLEDWQRDMINYIETCNYIDDVDALGDSDELIKRAKV